MKHMAFPVLLALSFVGASVSCLAGNAPTWTWDHNRVRAYQTDKQNPSASAYTVAVENTESYSVACNFTVKYVQYYQAQTGDDQFHLDKREVVAQERAYYVPAHGSADVRIEAQDADVLDAVEVDHLSCLAVEPHADEAADARVSEGLDSRNVSQAADSTVAQSSTSQPGQTLAK